MGSHGTETVGLGSVHISCCNEQLVGCLSILGTALRPPVPAEGMKSRKDRVKQGDR